MTTPTPADESFLQALFNALEQQELDPTDPRYLPLYEPGSDAILRIKRVIDRASSGSAQLLAGYRGCGKSTQLLRLKQLLEAQDQAVLYIDIEDYLGLESSIEVSHLLLALCGAIGEKLSQDVVIKGRPLKASVGEQLWKFVQGVTLKELSLGALKVELKANPTFRQQIKEGFAKNLGRFIQEVRVFIAECVKLVEKTLEGAKLVVLVDSVEHARGSSDEEPRVIESISHLFADHADKLRLPGVHLVYTVPPWLPILQPNVGSLYSGAGLQVLPAQKLRSEQGQPIPEGIDLLARLVEKRGNWQRLLGSRDNLETLIQKSGGHLRDLLKLLQVVSIDAVTLPVDASVLQSAQDQLKAGFLPIADDDACWLARIARTHRIGLERTEHTSTLARYFDGHLVLCYMNGTTWYDVHPLVRDLVIEQADQVERERAEQAARFEAARKDG